MSPSRSSAHIRDDDDTAALQSAKQTFVTAIQQGMDALMIHCGFSRERAVAILMRELQRVDRKEDDKVKLLRPTDQEMFQTMRDYGLGTEEATRALIVSKAFQREVTGAATTSGATPSDTFVQAIQRLVCTISLSNLLYDSDSSVDVASEDDEQESLMMQSDLRVSPVAKTNKRANVSAISTTKQTINSTQSSGSLSGRKRKINQAANDNKNNSMQRAQKKAVTTKQETSKFTGKRKADTAPANDKSTGIRPRADSVTKEVDAKITSVLPIAVVASATGSRAKRHHRSGSPGQPEDGDSSVAMLDGSCGSSNIPSET